MPLYVSVAPEGDRLMNAYAMLARCARHQLEIDQETYHAIVYPRHAMEGAWWAEAWQGPNLLITTARPGQEGRLTLPVLALRAG